MTIEKPMIETKDDYCMVAYMTRTSMAMRTAPLNDGKLFY